MRPRLATRLERERRRLGRSGLELSVVGFGAWAIGGGWGPLENRDSLAAIRRALDLGINWIDTAASYGWGHSEEVVGRSMALPIPHSCSRSASRSKGRTGRFCTTCCETPSGASARREPAPARCRGDRSLPAPLAYPRRADRGRLGRARRAEGRGAMQKMTIPARLVDEMPALTKRAEPLLASAAASCPFPH
jgi:Aldo/keto reductase family